MNAVPAVPPPSPRHGREDLATRPRGCPTAG
ncbi:hypothetical protein DC74_7314 [Streptomyces noursei]|uniref:Uncharacterized protein n=1 Tax=Streptomyces noursei TaxID=1971 RepID=A0A059WE90_STRNR|nr:hypothetical protein DC74_7314 [Streptomyces noursei]GCB95475.1 hypothetical protein SALB_08280 [Streptomyces noursei]